MGVWRHAGKQWSRVGWASPANSLLWLGVADLVGVAHPTFFWVLGSASGVADDAGLPPLLCAGRDVLLHARDLRSASPLCTA